MIKELISFIDQSPTAFQACDNVRKELLKNDFEELDEKKQWDLKTGGKYFVTRNNSSIISFVIPKVFTKLNLSASHLDSPSFKIKDNGEIIDQSMIKMNVEKYGGMIMSSWFDRPLSLAGRVLVEEKGELVTKLINFDEDLCMIVNPAIHLNREVNNGYKYNVFPDLLPIMGQGDKFSLNDLIKERFNLSSDVMGMDLYLYNRQKGCTWGVNNEFFSASRIDNLECTYALLQGIINSDNDQALNMCAMFDNEEVGSATKQGADSTFLNDTLARIKECFNLTNQEYLTMIANGLMISADNAHGYHPNYGNLSDSSNHPFLNGGIVIKYNGNQKYTTDGVSGAKFKMLCKQAGVKCQDYHNHSNVLGGSTLGNISNTNLSMDTVDIGLAQLAMHSTYETAGVEDLEALTKAMIQFYK